MKNGNPPSGIVDPEIIEAYEYAANKNILPALHDHIYFGFWSVCVDGGGHGWGTYPALDGHQMTDALLFLGQTERVLANWNYVMKFQREDGHIPIAVFPEHAGQISGNGDATSRVAENGALYRHWVPGDPLRALGAVSLIQNCEAIHDQTSDTNWLREQLGPINLSANYLLSLETSSGCIGGAGYYLERPTRIECDGVTQCHVVNAFRKVGKLNRLCNKGIEAEFYCNHAERIAGNFRKQFWIGNQFGEYLHPEHGLVSSHGLTDVDWAAIACDVASPEQIRALWPRLRDEPDFYYGGMPCGIATRPDTYEPWEFSYPDTMDLAAMGRVWYLECWARARMGDQEGLMASIRRVIHRGRAEGWYWRERYNASGQGYGAEKYCEYPANLIRILHRFVASPA